MAEVLSCHPSLEQESLIFVPSFTIRKAEISDLERLTELWLDQREYHCEYDNLYEYTEEAPHLWTEQIRRALFSETQCVYVAVIEGNIAGYIHGAIYPWPMSPYKYYGSLNTIIISARFRGQGYGRRLVKRLLNWFKEKGIKYVSLHVDYRNQTALKLYHSLGFQNYQERLMATLNAPNIG
ncbi:MAG: GNAT family N-acetyltransferase [Candidatus Hodarchaeota archaeon]